MNPHLSSEELDLLELGALSKDEAARAQAHLAGCAQCARQQESLSADAAQFRQFVQPRTQARVTARVAPRRFVLRWPALAASALAASLAVVVAVRLSGPGPADPYVAVRGEPVVRVIAARGSGQRVVEPGETLRAADRLRFEVDGAGAGYVLILSRDGEGAWSVYAPFGGAASAPLQSGTQRLPGAIELDATRGTEHLVAVFSDEALRADEVIAHLRDRAMPIRPGPLADVPGARAVQVLPFEKR